MYNCLIFDFRSSCSYIFFHFKKSEDSFKVNDKDIQSIQSEYIIKVFEWKVPNSKELIVPPDFFKDEILEAIQSYEF